MRGRGRCQHVLIRARVGAHWRQVLRGGDFKTVPAANLVPGDIIRIRIGDVIPADVKVRVSAPVFFS